MAGNFRRKKKPNECPDSHAVLQVSMYSDYDFCCLINTQTHIDNFWPIILLAQSAEPKRSRKLWASIVITESLLTLWYSVSFHCFIPDKHLTILLSLILYVVCGCIRCVIDLIIIIIICSIDFFRPRDCFTDFRSTVIIVLACDILAFCIDVRCQTKLACVVFQIHVKSLHYLLLFYFIVT